MMYTCNLCDIVHQLHFHLKNLKKKRYYSKRNNESHQTRHTQRIGKQTPPSSERNYKILSPNFSSYHGTIRAELIH